MKGTTIAAALLLVFGLQGLAYGGFNYAIESRDGASTSHQMQKVIMPLGLGTGAVIIGGLLLLWGGRERKEVNE
jgi:hypothetical protein